ncbi:glycosyltransferase family 2 protein [Halobaculum halobium]|uniref:Glycosyltransferase family 2 protein n=1 Tax=Halobaculum halobium TaxID=3032281 RepID=A0ABD5TCZ6_9EURY|nr:glycosyltransferase family 2 protein [Halobaculum sp. SYNS20]
MTVAIVGGLVIGLSYLLPVRLLGVVLAVASMTAVFYLSSVAIAHYADALPEWAQTVPIWTTLALPFTIALVLITQLNIAIPALTLVLLFALVLVFFYYWLVVPLALYQRLREQARDQSIDSWPELSVLIPAYNEEGYVGRTIESFLAADYPDNRLELIVIDDGSSDNTYEEALAYASETVTVLTKENGGKHSALNHGLAHTDAAHIVTVDADSVIAPDALRKLVRSLKANPNAGAVAGNVKVANRDSFITRLQALEYIVGINTFRRTFDLLGVVTVVPGCLGLFRREAIESVGRYSADTITEDFDLTIELLKHGVSIHHSNAIVSTEVPDTWRDLYRQRLRWFRGNFQTVLKHRTVFVDPNFGLLHSVGFPYLVLSMSVLPVLGVIILGVILWLVIQGSLSQFLGLLGLFILLQVLLSLLAIRIENDDLWLARYAPLSIVGYKQFLDGVLLKSVVDVFTHDDLVWTGPERIRQREQTPAADDQFED